jgi:hypothetical protein
LGCDYHGHIIFPGSHLGPNHHPDVGLKPETKLPLYLQPNNTTEYRPEVSISLSRYGRHSLPAIRSLVSLVLAVTSLVFILAKNIVGIREGWSRSPVMKLVVRDGCLGVMGLVGKSHPVLWKEAR